MTEQEFKNRYLTGMDIDQDRTPVFDMAMAVTCDGCHAVVRFLEESYRHDMKWFCRSCWKKVTEGINNETETQKYQSRYRRPK